MARYGLTVGDLNRVVEAAIGGAPIGITVDGRNRFSINVRYPQDLRSDVDRLRRLLVPVGGGGKPGGGMGGTTGALEPGLAPRLLLAQGMGMGGDQGPAGARGSARPGGDAATATDAPTLGWGGPGLRRRRHRPAPSCRSARWPRCASPAARP